ncbi:MAG: hypothetical protein NUV75_07345 [Gallionella sp.]|nr:hypothetical protein [Gallionella sp.]
MIQKSAAPILLLTASLDARARDLPLNGFNLSLEPLILGTFNSVGTFNSECAMAGGVGRREELG